MPIIKDKYNKGQQTRSKYETREINKARKEPVPQDISTQQKQQLETDNYRNNPANIQQISNTVSSSGISELENYNTSHFSFEAANTVGLILKLSKGESLKNMTIHNYNSTSSENIISIYWSVGDQDNVGFTVSGGIITATTGVSYMNRFFGTAFPYLSTVSLKNILSDNFKNVGKDIFFYGVASVVGPNITYNKG